MITTRFGWLVAALSIGLFDVVVGGQPRLPVVTSDRIVLENDLCRFAIGSNGVIAAFVNLADQQDYAEPNIPLMQAGRGEQHWESSTVEAKVDTLAVTFGDSGIQAKVKVDIRPRYFVLSVVGMTGEPDWLQISNLRVKVHKHAGALVNAAWDERFAACVLALNDKTDGGSHGVLTARAYRQFGIEGAKVAVLGVPTGSEDPGGKLLDAIEAVELEQGLPHPTINGVWIKRAPERFASYLMVSGINQKNVDDVITAARGGFGCIEFTWWKSTPSYEPNPQQFPDGLAGMKQVADKIHAAGMQVGLHIMQGMVGWGSKDDPYITPKADSRLLQDRHATLSIAIDTKATEIAVGEDLSSWPERGDLYLDGEIVQYTERTAKSFTGCLRGLHKTTVVSHPAGAKAGLLVNCFPIWGHTVYCPDVNSTLVDEICDRIARVFNEVHADMAYFDGGEEIARQPPAWRNQGRIVLGVQSRLKKPVIAEGNALYTHHSWHVITRGSPSYDPIYFGRRAYTLRFKGQNPANWVGNLLTGDVGWFAPHTWSPATDAVTPDEVMLLCLKALGGKAPISFSIHADHLGANKRMPEMLEIIRACDELKRRDYFSQKACAELVRPMAEHVLRPAADGGWDLCPLQFGPPRVVDARSALSQWTAKNPYGVQRPWVRIRARTALAPYGDPQNRVLADFTDGPGFQPDGAASADLFQHVQTTTEKTPDGTAAFCYRAENRGKSASGWSNLSLALPKPLDLSGHRRLGLWIRTDGKQGILNVQLATTDARRDHYIRLEGQGWTYVVLDSPEEDRIFDYAWPYHWTDLMYTCWPVYAKARQVNLYYNALPAASKTSTWIGRIEALAERPMPLESPSLEVANEKVTFPVKLQPEDYLEWDWDGRCRHYDRNGGVLADIQPQGVVHLAAGNNVVQFHSAPSDNTSQRAEVTLSLKGGPLPNAR